MSLLIQEPSIPVCPTLATELGLKEAIVLQHLHHWLEKNREAGRNYHRGHHWTFNSIRAWSEQFPWWGASTVKRTFKNLEEWGYLFSDNFNKKGYDKTKWYRIDYMLVRQLELRAHDKKRQAERAGAAIEVADPDLRANLGTSQSEPTYRVNKGQSSGHDDQVHRVTMNQPLGQKDPMDQSTLTQPIPELTQEPTQEPSQEQTDRTDKEQVEKPTSNPFSVPRKARHGIALVNFNDASQEPTGFPVSDADGNVRRVPYHKMFDLIESALHVGKKSPDEIFSWIAAHTATAGGKPIVIDDEQASEVLTEYQDHATTKNRAAGFRVVPTLHPRALKLLAT